MWVIILPIYLPQFMLNQSLTSFTIPQQIAYFSMEIGLDKSMNTYSGGLGILAGDTLKSAADMGLHMIGITLLSKEGWLKQILDLQKGQLELPDKWDYENILNLRPERFNLEIAGEDVAVQVWEYMILGQNGHIVPVFFLDADVAGNSDLVRKTSQNVYSDNSEVWYRQEMLLGLGGLKALEILDYPDIKTYHLNESHAAVLTLALKEKLGSWEDVKSRMCFTTHTPLRGAHQIFSTEQLQQFLPKKYFDLIPKELITDQGLGFTDLCIFASKFSNSVAKRHRKTSQEMYPNHKIEYITNGVHLPTWVSPYLLEIFDAQIPDWRGNHDYLRQVLGLDGEIIKQAHLKSKQNLVDFINNDQEFLGEKRDENLFDTKTFTIGFARRAVPYKRASLIFTELERLKKIATNFGGLQIIFAGKTGNNDFEGKKTIAEILAFCKQSDLHLRITYVENYNMDIAAKLVSGVDLWLNNPLPPLEASGTSGMKAAANGVPSFSIWDGWWPEGCIENATGWSIGQDLCVGDHCRLIEIEDLYSKLEHIILPLFYNQPDEWVQIQKNCIALNGSHFNTQRMLLEYLTKGYLKGVI
jgi:starch phosphorylase